MLCPLYRFFSILIAGVVLAQVLPTPARAQAPAPVATSPQADATKNDDHLLLLSLLDQLQPYRARVDLKGKAILSGSTTMADLGHQWRVNFQQFHPAVEFTGAADSSEAGLKALSENPAVIAGVSRNVDAEDLKRLKAGKCVDPLPIVVGLEAMELAVHASNPIDSISPQQFQALFAADANGKPVVNTWGDLGVKGPVASQPIARIEREPGSGTHNFVSKTLLGGAATAPSKSVAKSAAEVVTLVAKDPASVGITSLGQNDKQVRFVPLLINGEKVEPTERNILAGKYPLMRPLVLVIDKDQIAKDGGLRESILEYVLSRDGQMEVMKSGFYPLNPSFIRQQLASLSGVQLR
jgi:phosphate transport system substrate-binding protein